MNAETKGFLEDLASSKTSGDWTEAFENYVDCLPNAGIEYLGLDETSFLVERDKTLLFSIQMIEDILSESADSFPIGWLEAEANGWSFLGVTSLINNLGSPNDVGVYFRRLAETNFFDAFEDVIIVGAKTSSQLALDCSKLCRNAKLVLIQPERQVDQSVGDIVARLETVPANADPKSTQSAIVVSDPTYKDLVQEVSQQFPGDVAVLNCHHLGARTYQFLHAFGLLSEVLAMGTKPGAETTGFYAALRQEKRASRAYWRNVLRKLDTDAKPILSRVLCENVHERLGGRIFRRELQRLSETAT